MESNIILPGEDTLLSRNVTLCLTWVNIDWRLGPAPAAHGPLLVEDSPVLGTRNTFIRPPVVPVIASDPGDQEEETSKPEHGVCYQNLCTPLISVLRFVKSISLTGVY